MPKHRIIIGLDIGTSQIKALAAGRENGSSVWEVLGKTQVVSFGVRRGIVVNPEEVSKKVVDLLLQLQADIGRKIEDVYVNIGGSHLSSIPSRGTVVVSRADQKISEEDKNRVIQAAQAFPLSSNQEILNVLPKEFIVDGQGGIKEPIGMQGLRLEAEVLALCTFSPFLKNLITAVLNAGFQISDIIPSSIASSFAVLTPQQKELGVCLLDIGAGVTDMAIFEEGDLIHIAVFPIGSERITNDLAIGLKTDVEVAEKIKKEFGSCLLLGNKKEKIHNDEPIVFSHKMLVKIIEARVYQIFNLAKQEIKKISPKSLLPAGIVLTGGGVKLPKIIDLAKKELKLPVRLGLPKGLSGIAEDSAWSTAVGLVLSGIDLKKGENGGFWLAPVLTEGVIAKIKKFLKNFIPS